MSKDIAAQVGDEAFAEPLHAEKPAGACRRQHTADTGQVFTAQHLRAVVDGLAARGLLGTCDAVLSGYLGAAEAGAAVLDAVARVKAANPGALYACDPVMGDGNGPRGGPRGGDRGGGLYVDAALPDFFREHALPLADIVTPNVFELEIGDCFTPPADLTEEAETVPLVPCTEPHSHEVFELATAPAAEGENFPGKAELDAEATTQCVTPFDDYVGIDLLDADGLFFTFIKPSIDSWNDNDRTIVCVAGTTGGLIDQSVKGSNGQLPDFIDPDAIPTPTPTDEPDPS